MRPSLTLRLTMYSTAGPGMTSSASEAAAKAAMVEGDRHGDRRYSSDRRRRRVHSADRRRASRTQQRARGRAGRTARRSPAAISSSVHQRSSRTCSALSCSQVMRGLRLEALGDVDQVDLLALAVALAVDERDDVQPVPHVRPDRRRRAGRAPRELATQRHLGRLARVDAAAGQRPHACRCGNSKRTSSTRWSGVKHDRPDRLADAQRRRSGHGSRSGHSSGSSFRPSLNAWYIS